MTTAGEEAIRAAVNEATNFTACDRNPGRRSQADMLVELAEDLELFHDGSVGYADLRADGRRENAPAPVCEMPRPSP